MLYRNQSTAEVTPSKPRGILSALLWMVVALAGLFLVVGAPVAAQSTICSNSIAVPDPEDPGLVADCAVLLGAKDTLAGSASLNWSITTPINQGDGVTVSNNRVTRLSLGN